MAETCDDGKTAHPACGKSIVSKQHRQHTEMLSREQRNGLKQQSIGVGAEFFRVERATDF